MDMAPLEEALLAKDFDVEKHASQLIQTGTDIGGYMRDLDAAEVEVDRDIRDQVSTHHEDLVSQATSVEQLEIHLEMMQNHMMTLVSTSERLKAKVKEPYKVLHTQITTLSRLQATCDMLRRIIRILQLGKRLQAQLQGGPTEMTKAATSLQELSELWVPELNNIDVIEQDQRIILHAKADVERNADGMIARGMETQNQNHIGIALQVFQNLSILEKKVDHCLEQQLKQVKERLASSLDVTKITQAVEETNSATSGSASGGVTPSGPGKAALPAPGNMASFRATLWNNLESSLDYVYAKVTEVMTLQRLMCKKRDTSTHATFVDLLPVVKRDLLDNFWTKITQSLTDQLTKSTRDSNFLKQALEGEYPKLLRLFNDLWRRLAAASADMTYEELEKISSPFLNKNGEEERLRESLKVFEQAYLSRSLSRLFDPINLMFSSGETPSDLEVRQVLKGVASELNIALVDQRLSGVIGSNVAKTVKLMCVKCEGSLVTDGEASQVVGNPTQGQKKNVEVVNCLVMFRDGIHEMLTILQPGQEAESRITEACQEIDQQVQAALAPLLQSICDAIEAILLTVHQENFALETPEPGIEANACSLYMRELQDFVSRISTDFLAGFACRDAILFRDCIAPVASRCIEQFLRQASLLRPLGKAGQLKLASDCAQLELALEPLLGSSGAQGMACYDQLRAFRSLLFMQPEEIVASPLLGVTVPCSLALHFLFSKASEEFKSPHESAGWSMSRYSQWLDDHQAEGDRLQFLQGTLESYVAGTRARGEKSYAYPYNIMLRILEKGLPKAASH